MSKIVTVAVISAAIGLIGLGQATAGGMGDPSVVLRQKNAICEMQRRGEGPRYPDMCLPELPVGPVYDGHARRG